MIIPTSCPESKVYETVILPGMTYGCQIWSVSLKQSLRLRMCENRLPRILRYERDGGCGRLEKIAF